GGYSFGAFGAQAEWPLDRSVPAHFLFPLRADAAQIIHPNVGGAAAVRPMDHHNVAVWQFDFLVLGLDFRIVPFRNFAHEDINDDRAVEFEFWVARQIVSQDIRPGDRRG